MAEFCSNCGARLADNTNFCPNCGAAQNAAQTGRNTAPQYPHAPSNPYDTPAYRTPGQAGTGAVRQGTPAIGFSDRVNHPEILAAVKKNRKAAGIFSFFLVPVPLIGFLIYGLVSDKTEIRQALLTGGIVSLVFLAFALYGFAKQRKSNSYEATVIDKKTRLTYRHNRSDDNVRDMITEYVTVVRTTDGKTKKIVEQDGSLITAWDYLQVGDRFRYHPQFIFPYELYDKTKAPYIACVSCPAKNPPEADRCHKCGLPLLK